MSNKTAKQIFKQGSKTYYNASLFFPRKVRQDVFKFYSFVRVVDDLVDKTQPESDKFQRLAESYRNNSLTNTDLDLVLKNIYFIEAKYKLPSSYMEAFLESMKMDLQKKTYKNIDELLVYIYGSAEVIGLVMSRVLGVRKPGLKYAKLLGRSMQYINFLRDINEDLNLGRIYIPQDSLAKFSIEEFSPEYAKSNAQNFCKLVRREIERYCGWQKEAEEGFKFLPYRARIAVKTASDMYKWTASKIYENPMIIFETKVKPGKLRIAFTGVKNALGL